MKIHLGADHAGFLHKQKIREILEAKGYDVTDHGAHEHVEADDYPDYIRPVAESVASDHLSRGIVCGGSGQGEAIVANRVLGVRCAVYYGGNIDIVALSRKHNDANMISLGSRFISEDELEEIIGLWLSEDFSGDERHMRRIGKID